MQVVDTRTRYTFLNEGADPVAAVTVCEEPELSAKVAFFEVRGERERGASPVGRGASAACVALFGIDRVGGGGREGRTATHQNPIPPSFFFPPSFSLQGPPRLRRRRHPARVLHPHPAGGPQRHRLRERVPADPPGPRGRGSGRRRVCVARPCAGAAPRDGCEGGPAAGEAGVLARDRVAVRGEGADDQGEGEGEKGGGTGGVTRATR